MRISDWSSDVCSSNLVAIFPELKREADIMQVLFEHGIPVPKIHGYLVDPPCIVMDSLSGTRDMADAPDDKTRIAIGQDYMSAVARMHSLPVEPFVARSEEHTSELQSLMRISYAVFCLKKKTNTTNKQTNRKQ